MGLAEVQAVVARLSVDAALRDRFFADAGGVGVALGLSADEAVGLAAISRRGLDQFADSLRRKRRDQVRRVIPRAARALGREFFVLFERYVDESPPRGSRADLDDAVKFVESMVRRVDTIEPAWSVDLARYELGWRQAERAGWGLTARVFGYRVERLVDGSEAEGALRQTTVACWWKWPRRAMVQHWVWTMPKWRYR